MKITYEKYDKWEGRKVRPVDVPRGIKGIVEGEDLIIISDLRTSQLENKLRIQRIAEILREEGIIKGVEEDE